MRKKIVLLCIPARGHVQRALLVARGLVAAGAEVHAFCGCEFGVDFRREGTEFHDLYAERPLDLADSTSMPIPSRFVTFAAVYGESLTRDIAKLKPSLIVHGTFAVVALVVARQLGLPRVAICSGHNQSPRIAIPPLAFDARVATSTACRAAVNVLRDKFGISSASPFSYFDSLSGSLNVIPEPREFLRPEEIKDFEPCEFLGCIDPRRFQGLSQLHDPAAKSQGRVFVSFGTHSHRYYASVIEKAFARIIEAAGRLPEKTFTLTLGGAKVDLPAEIPRNVTVENFVTQPHILASSDIYITHHGSNSTHESVYLRKPMISYPLFADQPGLAKRCQEFGLACPLGTAPRCNFESEEVVRAIGQTEANYETTLANLAKAWHWEQKSIDARPDVIARILSCA